jgi:hypothetical protein
MEMPPKLEWVLKEERLLMSISTRKIEINQV